MNNKLRMKAERDGLKLIPEAPGPLGRWNPLWPGSRRWVRRCYCDMGIPIPQNPTDMGIPFIY